MITEYTTEDDMQTLRIWYDTKPFTEELENSIRALAQTVFSDDVIDCYIKERLKENNGEYDKPLPKEEPTLDDDTNVEETKEYIQQDTATQEVDETNEWNP